MLIWIREAWGVHAASGEQEPQQSCVQKLHGAANLKLEDSRDVLQCGMVEEPQAETESSSLHEEVGKQRLDCKGKGQRTNESVMIGM